MLTQVGLIHLITTLQALSSYKLRKKATFRLAILKTHYKEPHLKQFLIFVTMRILYRTGYRHTKDKTDIHSIGNLE